MPLFTVFGTAADAGLCVYAAPLEERDAPRGEVRGHADVESAVTVDEGGVLAVQLKALLIGDEHRHAGAVLAFVEHLFGYEIVGLEGELRLDVKGAFASLKIVLVDGSRPVDRGEGVVAVGLFLNSGKAHRTHTGKLYVADLGSVEIEQAGL